MLNPLYFRPVVAELKNLGRRIALARRKRGFTQVDLANRSNVSIATYRRIEKGDENVAISAVARVIFALNGMDSLKKVLEPTEDYQGNAMLEEALPQRIRRKKSDLPEGF